MMTLERPVWPRVAVTGHRPQNLTLDQQAWTKHELQRVAAKLRDEHGCKVAISGMALGADTWWAQAALEVGLELYAYIPFEAQAERWKEQDREVWRELRARATRERVFGGHYAVRFLHERNQGMVLDADVVVAVFDPMIRSGGTFATMGFAERHGKPIVACDVVARTTRVRLHRWVEYEPLGINES